MQGVCYRSCIVGAEKLVPDSSEAGPAEVLGARDQGAVVWFLRLQSKTE